MTPLHRGMIHYNFVNLKERHQKFVLCAENLYMLIVIMKTEIKSKLISMEVGDVEKWDIERMDTVRNAITRLQILNRGKIKFTTEIKDNHIFVYRIK